MSEDSGIIRNRPHKKADEGKFGLDLCPYPGMLAASEGLDTLKYSSDLTPLRPVAKSRGLVPIGIRFKSQMYMDEPGYNASEMEKDNDDREMQSSGLSTIPGLFDRFHKRGVI